MGEEELPALFLLWPLTGIREMMSGAGMGVRLPVSETPVKMTGGKQQLGGKTANKHTSAMCCMPLSAQLLVFFKNSPSHVTEDPLSHLQSCKVQMQDGSCS